MRRETANELSLLEEGLLIDKHDLDSAVIVQPDLFYRVSKQLAILTSQRDEAKQFLQETQARLELEMRREAYDNGDKITASEIEARVRVHKDTQKDQMHLNKLNEELNKYTALKEAFSQRSYMLREMVQLYLASYYAANDGLPRNRLRDNHADESRREMNRERRLR